MKKIECILTVWQLVKVHVEAEHERSGDKAKGRANGGESQKNCWRWQVQTLAQCEHCKVTFIQKWVSCKTDGAHRSEEPELSVMVEETLGESWKSVPLNLPNVQYLGNRHVLSHPPWKTKVIHNSQLPLLEFLLPEICHWPKKKNKTLKGFIYLLRRRLAVYFVLSSLVCYLMALNLVKMIQKFIWKN